jgi:hypothetical protein
LLPAIISNAVVIGAGMALAACSISIANVLIVTTRQAMVATGVLGRVTAGTRLLVFGTMPVGALLASAAASVIGIRQLFIVLAAIALAITTATATLRIPKLQEPAVATGQPPWRKASR